MTAISKSLPGWFRRRNQQQESEQDAPPEAGEGLSASTTGGSVESEPVVVWEAPNRMEAEIVKGHLESEGIPAIIKGEAVGTIFGFTTGDLAKASVLVPAALADRALEVLEADAGPIDEEHIIDKEGGDHGIEGRNEVEDDSGRDSAGSRSS